MTISKERLDIKLKSCARQIVKLALDLCKAFSNNQNADKIKKKHEKELAKYNKLIKKWNSLYSTSSNED